METQPPPSQPTTKPPKPKVKPSKTKHKATKTSAAPTVASLPKPEETSEGEAEADLEEEETKVEERDAANQTNSFFTLLSAAVSAVNFEEDKIPNFQDYLKNTGVKMAWVRAIVALYEEPKKPDDPLIYILKLMGLGLPSPKDVKYLQERVKELRVRLYELQTQNDEMNEVIRNQEQELELVGLYQDDRNYISDYISDDDALDLEYIPQYTTLGKPTNESEKKGVKLETKSTLETEEMLAPSQSKT